MIFKDTFVSFKGRETVSLLIITLILFNQTPSKLDEVSRDMKSDSGVWVRNCSIVYGHSTKKKKKGGKEKKKKGGISAVADCSSQNIYKAI